MRRTKAEQTAYEQVLRTGNRVTPSKSPAAIAYAKPRRRPSVTGPAGIEIPDPCNAYRKTIDERLLFHIVAAASAAWRAEQLPAELVRLTADHLAADLRGRFPPCDMAVLKRYGASTSIDTVPVEFEPYEDAEKIRLGVAIAVPLQREGYVVALAGANPIALKARRAPPADLRPFFIRVLGVRAAIRDEFKSAQREPGQFAAREKRQPTWAEIEAAWPRVGAWMTFQRESAR